MVTALRMLSRMNKGQEKKYHWNHLIFVTSIGTDSNAKPQAELLAAGSSDDCTNVSDSMPKDVTPDGYSNESGSNQILAVKKYHGSCPLP